MGYCVIHDYIYPDLADEDFCPHCKDTIDPNRLEVKARRWCHKHSITYPSDKKCYMCEKETALKYNQGKPRIRLCPPFVRNMMISALEYGCTKYFENSWRKGFLVADMYDAANRHLDAFFHDRENIDEESQCHHLDCALFSVAMMRYSVDLPGMDNRPPVTPEQIAEVIRLGMIEVEKRKAKENDNRRHRKVQEDPAIS